MSFFMKMWLWVKKFQLPDWLQDILERIFGYALEILKQFTLEEINTIQKNMNRLFLPINKPMIEKTKAAIPV